MSDQPKLPIAERKSHGYTFPATLVQACHIHGWPADEFDAVAQVMSELKASQEVAEELMGQAAEQRIGPYSLACMVQDYGLRVALGQFDKFKADTARWASSSRGTAHRAQQREGRGLSWLGAEGLATLGQIHKSNGMVSED